MILTIKPAENGYVVVYDGDENEQYFFVAIDIDDVREIVTSLLQIEKQSSVDMSPILYSQMPNDKT